MHADPSKVHRRDVKPRLRKCCKVSGGCATCTTSHISSGRSDTDGFGQSTCGMVTRAWSSSTGRTAEGARAQTRPNRRPAPSHSARDITRGLCRTPTDRPDPGTRLRPRARVLDRATGSARARPEIREDRARTLEGLENGKLLSLGDSDGTANAGQRVVTRYLGSTVTTST